MNGNFKLKFESFFKNNSSTMLAITGAIGVVLTAVCSARDTLNAKRKVDDANALLKIDSSNNSAELTKKEKLQISLPCYIPTILTGAATIGCVLGSNAISRNAQSALTSAYMVLDRSYKEYRESTREIYGEEGERRILEHISRKAYDEKEKRESNTKTFFDLYSLQFFESTIKEVDNAIDMVNDLYKKDGYVPLNAFYSCFGLEPSEYDTMVGWSKGAGSLYGYNKIKISIDPVEKEDGGVFYSITFDSEPTEDYIDL